MLTESSSVPMPILDPAAIDAVLPQTQCTQCGYAGCLPYAEAIANGSANINQCPPGGEEGIQALAAITGLPYAPLNPAHGAHKPLVLAVIDETQCIGCTICIQKCPVDAIVGAAKVMHTVIVVECTGCELCVAPCPVDCIALITMPPTHPAMTDKDSAASTARTRHRARLARLGRQAEERTRKKSAPPPSEMRAETAPAAIGSPEHKRHSIAAAQARARTRRDRADTP
jgi:Na+-translocating ferredoxin:NAD+ oxidoreductase subunit B